MDCVCYLSHRLFTNWNVIVAQIDTFHHRHWIRIQNYAKTKKKPIIFFFRKTNAVFLPSITDFIKGQHNDVQIVHQRSALNVLLQN